MKDHADTCRRPCYPGTDFYDDPSLVTHFDVRNTLFTIGDCNFIKIGFSGPANKQELLTSVCKTETKATAAKIIRIPDAEHILNLINEYKSDINGKIIILVRDPRAMITSRRKIAMWDGLWKRDKESMIKQLKKECRMMTKNKELAKSYPGKLKILKFA